MADRISISVTRTKKPTGLSVTRNGNNFTFSWKIGDADYGDGQILQYIWSKKPGGKWVSVNVGTKTTKKVVTIPASGFNPSTGKALDWVKFRVCGCRKHHQKGDKHYYYTFSQTSEKVYDVKAPNRPSLSAELSSSAANVCTFSWSAVSKSDSAEWLASVQCQTRLECNCTQTDGSKLSATGWINYNTTAAASGSATITEDTSVVNGSVSYTRWFRVRSRGPAGDSAWAYARHVYAIPYMTTNMAASASPSGTTGTVCRANWKTPLDAAHPVDQILVQYVFATPTTGLDCPAGASWTDALTIAYRDGSEAATWTIDRRVGNDECLYARVNTKHDGNITYGNAVRIDTGALTAPSGLSVDADSSTYNVTVDATNNCDAGASFLLVEYYSQYYPKGLGVGIIPHGSSSVTVKCPPWYGDTAVWFGVRAVVGSYRVTARPDGVNLYAVTALASSASIFSARYSSADIPVAPSDVSLEAIGADTIRVKFDYPWQAATGAELSWADHEDAWESTDQPQTYQIEDSDITAWNIGGLATGKRWYVRVRLIREDDSKTTYSGYSETQSIDLSSAPVIPVMSLSAAVIRADGEVTASWSFVSTDGSGQVAATVAQVIDGTTYRTLANVGTAQRAAISAERAGWTTGISYELAVCVTSESGRRSEWSAPVAVHVADPITASISQSSLVEQTLTEDNVERTVMALTAMPLTVTVTGAGLGGITRLVIERAETYRITRPDERDFNGFDGETIAIYTQVGDAQIIINNEDLIGALDDGAKYRLIATVQDGIGQMTEVDQEFEVHWAHQALVPTAVVVIDADEMIAKITPVAPDGALGTDVCDIYRLSADRPELIYPDAVFGQTYVDPYPTIGEHGGHRCVFKTANGDFITEDNELAWVDTDASDGDIFEHEDNIIDFGTDRVTLRYNADLSNTWDKDFSETQYLGGSIQGDWNPAVSKTGTLSAVVIADDTELIESMRRLAMHAGICHVRTKDGSSYPADVQVSDSYRHDTAHKLVTFDLKITRVDSEDYDGMTLAEWQAMEG